MPHASIIVPSVLGAAAAAAAFELTVFKPWRERNAPQGLHILLQDELTKFGRNAEALGRQLGAQAEEVGRDLSGRAEEVGRGVRTGLRKVGEDVQFAASEVREGFLELTGGSGPSSGWGSDESRDGANRQEEGGEERRGLMRGDGDWNEPSSSSSKTSALDRPMYAPAETDYDPDDEQTLASLTRNRRRTTAGAPRDDADNITLRDSSYRHHPSSAGPEDEDEGTAAFRAHQSLLGQEPSSSSVTGANPHSTIFDFDDFEAARDAFGIEDVQSPHHALGSPSIAASEGRPADDDADDEDEVDFFSTRQKVGEQDAVHLDASTLSLVNGDGDGEQRNATAAAPRSAPASEHSSSSDWQQAPSLVSRDGSETDGELVSAGGGGSGGRSGGSSVVGTGFSTYSGSEGGWVDLAPSSPENLSPPSSPASRPRLLQ
ncbi:hypothetical protein A4X09_0g5262 [Tilletia walkeri]|uniref:Uncharacterized protein n=1 Tax=Tilletia walkeri TaxID=117179 RepID=A0A8X7N646_9BASI|nr:hypothetical protein A4X09_0g5262 [Tilletia walkeri]